MAKRVAETKEAQRSVKVDRKRLFEEHLTSLAKAALEGLEAIREHTFEDGDYPSYCSAVALSRHVLEQSNRLRDDLGTFLSQFPGEENQE